MSMLFYISAILPIVATILAITRRHAVHALLYLIVSLLAIAVVFYLLGAPFMAALELIIYAGAIMVLFVFVVMMLNLGDAATEMETAWLRPRVWMARSILAAICLSRIGLSASSHGRTPRQPRARCTANRLASRCSGLMSLAWNSLPCF